MTEPRMSRSGEVMTVLGPVPASSLGATSTHEHLLLDLSAAWNLPVNAEEQRIATAPVGLENLSWVRENALRHRDNMVLEGLDLLASEVASFRRDGGGTLVDLTPVDLSRDAAGLREISKRTGVNVVMGCGHYVADVHPSDLLSRGLDVITQMMIDDIVDGVPVPAPMEDEPVAVRAGVIGEIGCSYPLAPGEEMVLRAAAQASHETGVPLVVHPGRSRTSPLAHVEFLNRLGVEPDRIAIAHIDRRLGSHRDRLDLASTGCWLAFDCFGLEPWLDEEVDDMWMPCDVERAQAIADLADAGHAGQVLLGQDIAMKHRLTQFGGHGYGHLLRSVRACFRRAHVSVGELDRFLIDNPATFLPRR